MNIYHPHLRLARLVLEAQSPLSIASGQAHPLLDTELVRDANGLPAIPGSSIAGVLRHLYRASFGEQEAAEVFGPMRDRGEEQGWASRLAVSWAHLLDASGRCVDGWQERLPADPVISLLQREAPLRRRRVRIGHRGAADAEARGLFDRAAVPKGTRFACEILLQHEDEKCLEQFWQRLKGLFSHPAMRLGGATRAGMGEVRCCAWWEGRFDLRREEDWQRWQRLSPRLDDRCGLVAQEIDAVRKREGWRCYRVFLEPVGGWRTGGPANVPLRAEDVDLAPHHEVVIDWSEGRARVLERQVVMPASGIKGALAHRTAFHANRLAGRWVETNAARIGEECPEVAEIFGKAAGSEDAHAGRIYLSDVWLERVPQTVVLMHTRIDRFTGGVMQGALFSEEVVWERKARVLQLEIWLQEGAVSAHAKKAFELALDDLVAGRLPIGASAARGHGFMQGRWEVA